ncbi:pinensin family lanthipeptide [bacterium]|nr:pinensin family lanthipeptide [bacterium]
MGKKLKLKLEDLKVQSFVTSSKKQLLGGAEPTLTGCPDPTNPNLGCTEAGCPTMQVACGGGTEFTCTGIYDCRTEACSYQQSGCGTCYTDCACQTGGGTACY